MLVKFTPIGWKEPMLIDSNKIHAEEHTIILPHSDTRMENFCYVDDTTLAYIENAKQHEGMRRVKFACYTDQFERGWYDGNNVFDDTGRKRDAIQIELTPYPLCEMEEQK